MTRQVSRWAVLAITLLAAGLRLCHLGAQSLWFDEAFTVVVTRLPLKESLDGILTLGADSPFFYLLLRPVTAVLGQSEFAYRLLPAFFGILTVPLMYRVGARFFRRWFAAQAMALLPLTPWMALAPDAGGGLARPAWRDGLGRGSRRQQRSLLWQSRLARCDGFYRGASEGGRCGGARRL